jgi:arylsulfatase A-like enzyme
VPLIVRYPALTAGNIVRDELVYNMDLMPTIFDLIGHNLGNNVNGQSLKPYLTGERRPDSGRETIYLEFHGIRCLHTQRALVSRTGFKYIFNPVDEDEFYDLNNDPGELHNLIEEAAYQADIKTMQRRLIEVADQAGDPVQNYAAKLFGDYSLLAAQPDVSAAYTANA